MLAASTMTDSYKRRMIDFKTMTPKSAFRSVIPHIIMCFMNVVMMFTNVLIISFWPKHGFYGAEAIGLISPFSLFFIHLTYIVVMNISATFRSKNVLSEATNMNSQGVIKTAFMTALFYGMILSVIYVIFVSVYTYASFCNYPLENTETFDLESRFHGAMGYAIASAPIIFCFSLIVILLKTLTYFDFYKFVYVMIGVLIGANIIVPAVFVYGIAYGGFGESNFMLGIILAGVGSFVTYASVMLISLFAVFRYTKAYTHETKMSFKLVRYIVADTIKPTCIFTCVSIGKSFALIAIALIIGLHNSNDVLISQIVVFNYINLFCAFPRGLGMGLMYKFYHVKIDDIDYCKNRQVISDIFRKCIRITLIYNTLIFLSYPLFAFIVFHPGNFEQIKSILINPDVASATNGGQLVVGDNPLLPNDISYAAFYGRCLYTMIPSMICAMFFSTGVLVSLVYTSFLNSLHNRHVSFKWIMLGLVCMVLLIYCCGYVTMLQMNKYASSAKAAGDYVAEAYYYNVIKWLDVTPVMIPMALYGIYITIVMRGIIIKNRKRLVNLHLWIARKTTWW